jgi:ubiquitin carboxyl-terminal hydrolase 25/28
VFDDPTTTSEPIRTQEDPFFSLLVDVPPTSFDRDIYDGLDAVFDDAPVEIEGKSARRTISLLDLPPVLQIQLQRVQYDREKGRIFKSNAHLSFPDELNLGRYLDVQGSDLIEKRARTNALRSELEGTRARLAKLEQVSLATYALISYISTSLILHPHRDRTRTKHNN